MYITSTSQHEPKSACRDILASQDGHVSFSSNMTFSLLKASLCHHTSKQWVRSFSFFLTPSMSGLLKHGISYR